MSTSANLRTRIAVVVAAAAVTLGASACGGGSVAALVASLVPASAPIYLELTLRPQGDQEANVRETIGTVLGSADVDGAVEGMRTQLLEESGLAYGEDVAPWLGEHAGVFFTSFAGPEPDGAVIIESTDQEAAAAAISKSAKSESGIEQREHRGVSYQVSDDNTAIGLVDEFVVAGTENGLKAAIDTAEGGDALENTDGFDAMGDLPEERLGALYADLGEIVKAAVEQGQIPAAQLGPLSGQIDKLDDAVLAGALQTDGSSITVEGSVSGLPEDSAKKTESGLLRELPADSTLAVALGNLGAQASEALKQAEGQPGFRDVAQALQAFAGIDLARDIVPWLGEGALFARGAGLTDIGAGLLIRSTDADASRKTVEKIRKALESLGVSGSPLGAVSVGPLNLEGAEGFTISGIEGLPVPVEVAARGEEVVIAVGSGAAKDVLEPDGTLGESEAFSGAAGGLGSDLDPVGYIAVGEAAKLISALASQADPAEAAGVNQATEVAKRFKTLAIGAAGEGGEASFKLVLALEG